MRVPATRYSRSLLCGVIAALVVSVGWVKEAVANQCNTWLNAGGDKAKAAQRATLYSKCQQTCTNTVKSNGKTYKVWKSATGGCTVCKEPINNQCKADYEPGDLTVRMRHHLPDDATQIPSPFDYDGDSQLRSGIKASTFTSFQGVAFETLKNRVAATLGRAVNSDDPGSVVIQGFDSDPLLFSLSRLSDSEIGVLSRSLADIVQSTARRAPQITHSQVAGISITPAPTAQAVPGREAKPSVNPLQHALDNRGGATVRDYDGRLYLTQKGVDIDMVNAWAIEGAAPSLGTSLGRRNVIVAVIDDGFNLHGSEFRRNLFINTGESPCDQVDNDGNGYIDDTNGWDAVLGHGCYRDGALSEVVNGPGAGRKGHGTHVASIIASPPAQYTGSEATGVAPFVTILPIKAYNSAYGGFYSDGRIAAYRYVLDLKKQGAAIAVVNTSFTGSCSAMGDLERNAIQALVDAGITVVGAAGNEGSFESGGGDPQCPGALGATAKDPRGTMGVISVAMSAPGPECSSNQRCGGSVPLNPRSNYGPVVNTAAPGTGVYANGELRSGTSMASPHVSGVIALMYSVNPFIKPAQVEAIISDPANSKPMGFIVQSRGLLNAKSVIERAARDVIAVKVENSAGNGVARQVVAFRDVTRTGSKAGARMSRTDASGLAFFSRPPGGSRVEIYVPGGPDRPQIINVDSSSLVRLRLRAAPSAQ